MEDNRQFYQVIHSHYDVRTSDHLEHGFEEERDYRKALRLLVERWRDRIGEAIEERHEFLLLRFHDTPGGMPDEAWIPRLLLNSVPIPDYMIERESTSSDAIEAELDEAFGFD